LSRTFGVFAEIYVPDTSGTSQGKPVPSTSSTSQEEPVPSTSHLESEPEDLDSNNPENDVQVPVLKLEGGNAEDLFKLIRKYFSDFEIQEKNIKYWICKRRG
jgi:hypothetical protein